MHEAADLLLEKIKVTKELRLYGPLFLEGDTNETDASAISVATGTTFIIQTGGAETRTLANGVEGQVKTIICITYAANVVITPANFVGTTITMTAAGGAWTGVFKKGEWITLASNAQCTVA